MSKSVQAFLVVGLSFGDEGKGAVVDRLTRLHGASLIVRFNGGPQAAHNVITEDGRHHTFSQFGSGMLNSGTMTHLSRFMLVEPYSLLNEADALKKVGVPDALSLLTIEERCPVITPYHWMANRICELARGKNRHGSCGFGVGEVRLDQTRGHKILTADHLRNAFETVKLLAEIQCRKAAELKGMRDVNSETQKLFNQMISTTPVSVYESGYGNLISRIFNQIVDDQWLSRQRGTMVFEGAQGVLLDENFGFAPYNSWTNTTFHNAYILLSNFTDSPAYTRIGVLRTYSTRHGPGPFVPECLQLCFSEPHNGAHPWQGPFRQGHFDSVATRYAIRCAGGIDELHVTHLDRFPSGRAYTWIDDYLLPGRQGFVHDHLPSTNHLFNCSPVLSASTEDPLISIAHSLGVSARVLDAQTLYERVASAS